MSEAGFCRNSPNLNHEGGITAPGRFPEPSHTSSNSCTKLAHAAPLGLKRPLSATIAPCLLGGHDQLLGHLRGFRIPRRPKVIRRLRLLRRITYSRFDAEVLIHTTQELHACAVFATPQNRISSQNIITCSARSRTRNSFYMLAESECR